MGFFAELDSNSEKSSPFSKMLEVVQKQKNYLTNDFYSLNQQFRRILPQQFHQPFIEGFGPPFMVQFLDMEVMITGLTEFKILRNITVFEQLTQRIVIQKEKQIRQTSKSLKDEEKKKPKSTPFIKSQNLSELSRLNQDIMHLLDKNERGLDESGFVINSKNLDTINQNQSIDKSVVDSASFGAIKSDIKTITDSKGVGPYLNQSPELSGQQSLKHSSKVIMSVRSHPNISVEVPSKMTSKMGNFKRNWLNGTRSSDLNSQHTFTPPQALSPRIQSLQGGYYRIPNLNESKSYEKSSFKISQSSNPVSLIRGFPSQKIDLKKLIPKIGISEKGEQIEEKLFDNQALKATHKPLLPPLIDMEVKPILKVKAIMKKRQKSPEYRNKREINQSPTKFFNHPGQVKTPHFPIWMNNKQDETELVVKGIQLIESNYEDFDPQ